jgi:zinc protease
VLVACSRSCTSTASCRIVHVNQWFHVGRNERRRSGFAHLFEHLMFQGSTHVPGGAFR